MSQNIKKGSRLKDFKENFYNLYYNVNNLIFQILFVNK